MVRKGRQAGAKHNTNSRKLSDTQVLEVRKKSGQFSQKELAKQFNVSQGSISNIVTGNTWRRL
jgi:DNA-binding transcriptional regulator YiaG